MVSGEPLLEVPSEAGLVCLARREAGRFPTEYGATIWVGTARQSG